MFKRRRRRAKKGFFSRLIRASVSVVILTALVLGVSLFVKEISNLDTKKALSFTDPYLKKLGLNSDVVGQVAGSVAQRVFDTSINPSEPTATSNDNITQTSSAKTVREQDGGVVKSKELLTKIAVMSDVHNDFDVLEKALIKAKQEGIDVVFFIGDLTDLGVESNLVAGKKVLDDSGLTYYAIPGDRDLYATSSSENFYKVFNTINSGNNTINLNGVRFLLFDNSANFTPIEEKKMAWFRSNIQDTDVVLFAQPIYHPLKSALTPVMGTYDGEDVEGVKPQAEEILKLVRDSNAKLVLGGDHHKFSRSIDSIRKDLEHVVTGALTTSGVNLGSPSLTLVSLYEDNSYNISELIIE